MDGPGEDGRRGKTAFERYFFDGFMGIYDQKMISTFEAKLDDVLFGGLAGGVFE